LTEPPAPPSSETRAAAALTQGHRYDLMLAQPIAIRAAGLDAAHRITRRLQQVVNEALKADTELIELEDGAWFREDTPRCDGSLSCRANLHEAGCKRKRS
jgi:hypothetical protein